MPERKLAPCVLIGRLQHKLWNRSRCRGAGRGRGEAGGIVKLWAAISVAKFIGMRNPRQNQSDMSNARIKDILLVKHHLPGQDPTGWPV